MSVPDLTATSDSGSSNTDNLTSVTTPVFTGTAEAGATVQLLEGSTVLGTTTANGFGQLDDYLQRPGQRRPQLRARATDLAGNQSTSAALAVTIDTTTPFVSTPDLAATSDSGTSNTDNLTNVTTPVFTGTTTAGATVQLLDGATVVGSATADGAGNWSITSSVLANGVHNISAPATDLAGNQATSAALAVTIDTLTPTVSVPDLTATSDSGSSNTDNLTSVTTPVFTGTGEAGATVQLLEGSTVLGHDDSRWLGQLVDYLQRPGRGRAQPLGAGHRCGREHQRGFRCADGDDRYQQSRGLGPRSGCHQRQRGAPIATTSPVSRRSLSPARRQRARR